MLLKKYLNILYYIFITKKIIRFTTFIFYAIYFSITGYNVSCICNFLLLFDTNIIFYYTYYVNRDFIFYLSLAIK